MPQVESLQTEIVIVDKASKAFDDIERSAGRASLATDKNLNRVEALEGGFVDFAAKAGPAIYAVEKALNLMYQAAEKAIQAIGRGDDIAKTSRALHINAQSFQELSYAIQRGGGSSQDFSLGLRTLNRQMAELKKGSSAAREAFGRLGLSVEDVEKMGLEGTLYAVSDALHNMEDANAVDDVMQTLLGRGGYKLASAFSVGSKELDNLREQARKTGAIMQDDALAMSEAGADKLLTATLSIQSVWQNISTAIMPAVVDALERVSQFFIEHQESISKIEKLVSRTIGAALDAVFAIADVAANVADTLIAPLADFGNALFDQFETVFTAGGALTKNDNEAIIDLNTKHFGLIERHIQDVAEEVGYVGEDISKHYTKLDELVKKTTTQTVPKSFEDYENEKFDAILKDSRIRMAEENAKAMSGSAWESMDELERLDKVREVYDKFGEEGINSAADLQAFRESVKQGEIELKALNTIIEEQTARHAATYDKYKQLGEQIKSREHMAGITAAERAYNNETARLSGERKRLADALEDSQNKYSEAFNRRADLETDLQGKRTAIGNAMATIVMRTSNIDKNTRRVKIDKDSILFMKEMATAQIIYNYNNNTNTANFNQSFGNGNAATVQKAARDGLSMARRGSASSFAG